MPSSGKLPGELLDRRKGFELRNGESGMLPSSGNSLAAGADALHVIWLA